MFPSIALLNALRMVEIAGRADIRVSAGAQAPRTLVTATSHGPNGLAGVEFPVPTFKPVNEPATDLINSIEPAVREKCPLSRSVPPPLSVRFARAAT